MTADVAKVLESAADLLEKPGAWIQGDFARDANGDGLAMGYDPKATCWCAVGALEKALGPSAEKDIAHYWEALEIALPDGFSSVPDWNDTKGRTQAEIVATLREAAGLARSEIAS